MEGQIEVTELMALKSSAKVSGTVYYGQLSVEAGAQPVGTSPGMQHTKTTKHAVHGTTHRNITKHGFHGTAHANNRA